VNDAIPVCARRFVGYSEQPPYLWLVDLDQRAIEPAAPDVTSIPQASTTLSASTTWWACGAVRGGTNSPSI
jgi:hypothetical protein